MKPEEIIAGIVESSKYYRLVELWNSEHDNNECLSSEIIKIIQILNERTNEKKKSFLRSSGLKPCKSHANIINFRVPQNVQAAKDEFDKELKKQMPVFIQLMNLIPAEILMPEPIAV